MVFIVMKQGKKVKTLKAAKMETILNNYVKYCNEKGFKKCIYTTESFGNSAWQNSKGEVMTLVTAF